MCFESRLEVLTVVARDNNVKIGTMHLDGLGLSPVEQVLRQEITRPDGDCVFTFNI